MSSSSSPAGEVGSGEPTASRYSWSIKLSSSAFFLDEPLSGHVELSVRDVYMAATIQLSITQHIAVKVSDKVIQLSQKLTKQPLQLLTDHPRTQFCMGKHFLPFTIQADADWSEIQDQYLPKVKASSNQSSEVDEKTPAKQWMLPTIDWDHAEDIAVYTGNARSAGVQIFYTLDCDSLCAVRGSAIQRVASTVVAILGSQEPVWKHPPVFSAAYTPLQGKEIPNTINANQTNITNQSKVSLKAKLDQKVYSPGQTIQLQLQVSNGSSLPIVSIQATLLNSAVIRAAMDNFSTLHTAALSTANYKQIIESGKSVETSISLQVPDSVLTRFSSFISNSKLLLDVILRISVTLEGLPEHIFQTSISISKPPRESGFQPTLAFSLPSDPQGKRILWVKDSEATACPFCTSHAFGFLKRKHHCRGCGRIVCLHHSRQIPAPTLFGTKPRRVCKSCEQTLTAASNAGKNAQADLSETKLSTVGDQSKSGITSTPPSSVSLAPLPTFEESNHGEAANQTNEIQSEPDTPLSTEGEDEDTPPSSPSV